MTSESEPLHPLIIEIAEAFTPHSLGAGLNDEDFAKWAQAIGKAPQQKQLRSHLVVTAAELQRNKAVRAATQLVALALIGATSDTVREQLERDGLDTTVTNELILNAKRQKPVDGLSTPEKDGGVSMRKP